MVLSEIGLSDILSQGPGAEQQPPSLREGQIWISTQTP